MTGFIQALSLVIASLIFSTVLMAYPTPARAEDEGAEQVVSSKTEHFTFVYRRRYLPIIQSTISEADEVRAEMLEQLGSEQRGPRVEVRFARNIEEMRSLCPREPPIWADAVAFSPDNIIVISLTTSHHRPVSLETVFRHEFAHLVLRWLIGENSVPRWFNEGMAIMLSGEMSMERLQLLWPVAARGETTPIRRLDRNFPQREFDANQAYAESADMVRFLARFQGRWRLRELLQRIHGGQPFYEAMSATWGMTIRNLEAEWRRDLRNRYSVIPSVTAGITLWVLVGLFSIVAYIKRRRDVRRRIDAMDDEQPRIEGSVQ